MPRFQIFNNKSVLEPGSYTRTQGGEKKAPDAISSGKVMIIDTGSGAGFGGGSGALGTAFNGKKSIYEFTELGDFRDWMRGGKLWDIAERIFKPSTDDSVRGCESLQYISAKESTPASVTMKFGTEAANVIANGGKLGIKTNAEGIGANGTIVSNKLHSGFGFKVVSAGAGALKLLIYVGTYKGLDYNNQPIGGQTAPETTAKLLFESKAFTNFNSLLAEIRGSGEFYNNVGYIDEANTIVYGTGIHAGVNDTTTVLTPFTGGTETYSTAALDEAIAAMQEVDNVYFLCDQFGIVDGVDVENTKLFTALTTLGIYEKFMVVGGGKDSTERAQTMNSSLAMAQFYNSPYVYVVHGDILEKNVGKPGFRRLNVLYHAATIVGRLAGNAPQDPITWDDLDIDGVVDDLNIPARTALLKGGVIHLRDVDGKFVVNQEVNTMQQNDDAIYPDGTSPEGSIMRIAAILNKTIKKRTEKRFVGGNFNTSDPADVKSYLEDILIGSTATPITDNLIINFKNISVTFSGTDYDISYGFTVNGPVNRLFITGFMFSPSSN